MADSPLKDTEGPVGVTIKTDGSKIPDTAQIASVKVRREVNRIPEATVVIEAGSVPEQEFPEVDGTTYAIGKEITVAGYYGDAAETEIFSGVILSQRLRINDRRGPRLELLCRDKASCMTLSRASALFEAKKDSDIMKEIVEAAGLSADITATTSAARNQIRHDATDWDFLRALADRNGHLITVAGGKLTSAPPDTSASAVLTLTLGVDIVEFDAEANTSALYATAKGRGWDDAGQQTVEGVGGSLPAATWGDQSSGTLADAPAERAHLFTSPVPFESGDIKVFADSRLMRSVLSAVQGTCTFQGSGAVVPGDMIELTGVGDHFGGTAFVSGVHHQIEDGSWTTRAQLGLSDEWLSDSSKLGGAGAAGLTTPIHGLQIATVLQVNEDPDGRQRIKISLPMIGAEPAEVWARFAQPYASNAAGIQFMPEVADEVVVAFMNSDPDAPVVIGALHNGKAAQANTPDTDNTIKSIVTREKLKIEFDDDKKVITVETPGGHSLKLDDDAQSITMQDSNGNKIEMSSSGITIESPADISISATGNVDIAATADATLSGMNVTASADMQMKASGNASAEFSASGQTTVKGAMVMIN